MSSTESTTHSPTRLAETTAAVESEETAVTEVRIGPDGRIFVFGASQRVLEVLDAADLGDDGLRRRLAALRGDDTDTDRGGEQP